MRTYLSSNGPGTTRNRQDAHPTPNEAHRDEHHGPGIVANAAALLPVHRDPAMAPFYGAPPMAMLTVGAGAVLVGKDLIGLSAPARRTGPLDPADRSCYAMFGISLLASLITITMLWGPPAGRCRSAGNLRDATGCDGALKTRVPGSGPGSADAL
jgi:hypothetical protein